MRKRKPKAFHTQRENVGGGRWHAYTELVWLPPLLQPVKRRAWVYKAARVDAAYHAPLRAPVVPVYPQLRPEAMADAQDMFGGRMISSYRGVSGYHRDHTGEIVDANLDRHDMGKRIHAGWAYNANTRKKIEKR